MSVTVDLAAIAHNAATMAAAARRAGLVPVAVFKEAYALAPIVEAVARGGVVERMASTTAGARAVNLVEGPACGLMGLLAPDFPTEVVRDHPETIHVNFATARRAATLSARHRVWLEVMTSDGREGMDAGALVRGLEADPALTAVLATRTGLFFNWGCMGSAPTPAEVAWAGDLVMMVAARFGRRPEICVGGSSLLPGLDAVAQRLAGARFRIGEALIAGGVPDDDGERFDLRAPISITATVRDVRDDGLVLIDHGSTSFEISDARTSQGELLKSSSEACLLRLAAGASQPRIGDSIRLALGYRSILRALLNRNHQISFSDAASDLAEADHDRAASS